MGTLDYRMPRVFYSGEYTYAQRQVVIGAVAFTILGGGFVWLAGPWSATPNWLLSGVGGLAVAFAVSLIVFYFRADVIALRISEDGVANGREHYPWSAIKQVEAVSNGGKVSILVSVKGGRTLPRTLMAVPVIQTPEYVALVRELRAEVLPAHPHVILLDKVRALET